MPIPTLPYGPFQNRPLYLYDDDPIEAIFEGCFKIAMRAEQCAPDFSNVYTTEYMQLRELRALRAEERKHNTVTTLPSLDRHMCNIDTSIICGGCAVKMVSSDVSFDIGYYMLLLEDDQYILYGPGGKIYWAGVHNRVPDDGFTYTAYLDGVDPITADTLLEFTYKLKMYGHPQVGLTNSNGPRRTELYHKPKFRDLLGPMWDGKQGIRYEAPNVYRRNSQ